MKVTVYPFGSDLAESTEYAIAHGVISMLNVRRASSVSVDPSGRRNPIRERWIPTAPGEGDLRSRSYPSGTAMFFDDLQARDPDEMLLDVALVGRAK
ncbi:hypothetical protein K2Z84_22865 [Candidatus Binatia bacterium]|nr:hypothetical protein [Candidatus Binatia bacterium]